MYSNRDYNVAAAQANPGSLLSWYKQLIRLRQAQPALSLGDYTLVPTSASPVMAYLRSYQGQHLLVAVNTWSEGYADLSFDLNRAKLSPGTYALRPLLGTGSPRTVQLAENGRIQGLSLGPHETQVFEWSQPVSRLEVLSKGTLSLFPNPAENRMQVYWEAATGNRITWQVSDLQGKVHQQGSQQPWQQQRLSLDLQQLPPGVYLLTLSQENIQAAALFQKE